MPKVCVEFDQQSTEPPVLKTHSQVIGDGTSTEYDVAHGFHNADVVWTVRNLATGSVTGYDIEAVSEPDTLRLSFPAALPAGGARVSVISVE